MTSPSPDNIIDVAIIGGGVSGAYTAYRLMNTAPSESPVLQDILKQSGKEKLNVRLIEMGDRIGGRLWSINLDGLPNVPADQGGMYFSDFHCNVHGLCTQELNLETNETQVYSRSRLQYFRRHRFWAEDYTLPVESRHLVNDYYPRVVPFFLREEEKWKSPSGLLSDTLGKVRGLKERANALKVAYQHGEIDHAVSVFNEMSTHLREQKVEHPDFDTEQPIYNFGFWNFLLDIYSIEAYTMIKQGTPLHSNYGNCNLYDALLGFVRNSFINPSYYGITKGYDQLPKKLVCEFKKKGGSVHKKTQLLNLHPACINGEQLVKLTLACPTNSSKLKKRYARHVVLALPQLALNKLFESKSPIFNDGQFQKDLLDTVTVCPASKLFLSYEEAWWEQINRFGDPITTGSSLTDLPLLLCNYIGKDLNEQSLLLASTADSVRHPFLVSQPSSRSGKKRSYNFKYQVKTPKKPDDEPFDPSLERIVNQAQRQLKEMHGIDIPEPIGALFCAWEDEPFGGGWHYWNLGVQSWEVAKSIRQPYPKHNIFICGEAYSDLQGWVEGALNSAEMVLKEHFDLPHPTWVPDNYYNTFD